MNSTSHIFVLDSHHPEGKPDCYTLRCDHCGVRASVRMPIALSEFTGITNGFIARHRNCSLVEPVEKPAGGAT